MDQVKKPHFEAARRLYDSTALEFFNTTTSYVSPDLTLQFIYASGYLIYQVLNTPPRFQSTDYKLREFVARNGVRIISKNSPIYFGPECIALHGAFREFDKKPTVAYVGTWEEYIAIRNRILDACDDLREQLHMQPDWRPAIIEARDGIEDK